MASRSNVEIDSSGDPVTVFAHGHQRDRERAGPLRAERRCSARSCRWQWFAALLFVGFFTFFLGKISADTIMQQSMPDDFRGRAFALFDIAYNAGFIVPALILSFLWVEGDASRTRAILMVSGVIFLGLTLVIYRWSRRIRDQFAPQDDLVKVE